MIYNGFLKKKVNERKNQLIDHKVWNIKNPIFWYLTKEKNEDSRR